jgi:FkbM family methyltransferase
MAQEVRKLARKVPGLHFAYRTLGHWRHNARDLMDSYLLPALTPKPCPLGFVFTGLHSQHHRSMQNGTFEPQEVKLLSVLLKRVDLFIDVGANVGYFTCLARHSGVPAIAVEPMERNLALLMQNLTLNGWDDTEVVASGMSDKTGIARLFGASSTGASLIGNWAGAQSSISRFIPLSTLDTITGGRFPDRRMLIKMDVEGHEYAALLGAQNLLARPVPPIWLIEITNSQFHPSGSNPHYLATFSLFWKNGYRTLGLGPDGLREVGEAQISAQARPGTADPGSVINYLCLPRDLQPEQDLATYASFINAAETPV